MSRKLDWVYKSSGTDLTTTTLTTKLDNAYRMIDDGQYVWVTCGTDGIAIYQYYGNSTDDEPDWSTLDATWYTRYDTPLHLKLRLITFIKITATQILRTTCVPAFSLLPGLASTDPDGVYNVSGTNVTVLTLASGERAITTAVARAGNALNAKFIVKDSSYIYISNGTTFSEVMRFGISTQDYSSNMFMSVPDATTGIYPTMNSNLCLANAKLWAVGSYYDDSTPQSLVSYNLSTTALVNTSIPVRPGSQQSWVADGFNSNVYVSHYNGWGVSRFSYSNVFGATMRVNGYPTGIFTNSSGSIYVSSYAGMLSTINGSTDTVANSWGTESKLLSFDVDPNNSAYVWFTNSAGAIAKHYLNDHTQIEISNGTDDWVYTHDRLVQYANGTAISVLKSASNQQQPNIVSNTYFDGTNTYHPELIITNATGTVTLVEYIDYTVNTTSGLITFLATSTVVTSPSSPTSLKLYYYYKSFYPFFSMITAQKTYTSGGTITVSPYLFTISNNMLFAIRLDTNLTHLSASTGVTGQGAVVAGSNQYFGD